MDAQDGRCTVTDTTINASIEHLVRIGDTDRRALIAALRELAGLVDHDLTPRKPLVHGMFGGHYEGIDGRETYVGACGTVNASPLTGLWGCITCDGCIEALKDDKIGGSA